MNANHPFIGKRAGIVRHNAYDLLVRREAETLLNAGFAVDVLCLQTPGSVRAKTETINGVQMHYPPFGRQKGSIVRYLLDYLAFFLFVAFKLTTLHLRRPLALIQINNMPDFLVFATLIPRLLGAKVTMVMYEPTPELWATRYNAPKLVHALEIIEQLALRYAHHVIAVTEQMRQTFIKRGTPAKKTSVILNVTDERLFGQDVPPRSKDNPEQFVLICHGAIEERYGHDTMLMAIDRLKAQIPTLQLRILGYGSYLSEFLRRIEQMNLQPYVRYLGFVPLAEMVAELKGADVGLVAQKSSPYSNLVHTGKMYDYLNFDLPVLLSRLNAVAAYFDETCMAFFQPGDPDSLAEAILDLYQHPEKRQRLAKNGRDRYQRYRWSEQKKIYLNLYQQLLVASR